MIAQDIYRPETTRCILPKLELSRFERLTSHGTNADTLFRKTVKIIRFSVQKKSVSETQSHIELMRRISEMKDKRAFGALFAYYAPRVKSYLVRLGLDANAADDTAQDVMVLMWRKAHLFDPQKGQLSTWLFRIARNKFIDTKRKRKYPEVDIADHAATIVSDDKTDQAAIASQDQLAVSEAMKTLSPQQRRVIELSFFEDISHSQMAEKLSLPLGTVKSRIRLAFNGLREALGDMK